VLQVINSSPGDLAPVFDAILEKAHTLCGASHGALVTYDGEYFRAVATHELPAPFAHLLRQPFRPEPASPQAQLLRGERLVHMPDASALHGPGWDGPRTRAAREAGLRALLMLPLRKDSRLLGYITANRHEPGPFTDKQIALLQNFAAQAVIAMENARLITETREALEQQTATAEVLQVINSSPGDLAPVFDAMLDKALDLCGAAFGNLWTYDGEMFHAGAVRRVPKPYADALSRTPVPPRPGAVLGQIAAGSISAQVLDAAADEPYLGTPVVELGHARTIAGVSLRKDDALLGAITIYRQEVRPFTDKQIALLQNFAAQAVIAMENARLLTETREALEQQTATAEVLQVINSSPGNLNPVFEAIVETAVRLCDAEMANLDTHDGERYRPVAAFAATEEGRAFLRGLEIVPGRGTTAGRALLERRAVHIADITADPEYALPEAVTIMNYRTTLAVPLLREGEPIGVIILARSRVAPFSQRQIALVENFAAQGVIAMENARLLTETREALEQQTATAEVLQVINSSSGDLAPVFAAILEKAHSLCDVARGALITYDGEHFRGVAMRGMPEPFAEKLRGPFKAGPNFAPDPSVLALPTDGAITDRLLRGERMIHVTDLAAEPVLAPLSRAAAEAGSRTVLRIPLRKDDVLLGYITAHRTEVRPFLEKEIALLENFAAQAVIAMDNARLLNELRERTSDLQESLEYQTATSDVLKVISRSGAELEPVLDTLVETAARLCEAEKAMIYRLSDGLYRTAASFGFPPEYKAFIERNPITPSRGTLTGRTVIERCTVHIEDAATDPEYTWAESQQRGNLRTLLGVPLLREDVVVGVLALGRSRVERFTEKQIALVTTFADQAVIAMENARLLGELRGRTEEIAGWNRELEARVAEQVEELGRVGRLKRFLAPQLAELIVSHGDEKILESHRREIVVVFCDLRGYTAFTETAEPEEVLDFLREYHGALGPLVSQFEGTLDQFSGDGIMVFFNDPVPCPDPAERAVKMAMAMREAAGELIASWRRRRGRVLGFGAGIAQGYATLGQIGFAERSGYTAIGTVCNLAARLCAEAKDGQILLAQRVAVAVEETTPVEEVGELTLRGLSQPVVAYNVPLVGGHAALRVIEGGPPSAN